jgi:flagellar hook-basal body complex protein FliE
MKQAQLEREEQARLKQEFEKKQKAELDNFKQLLLDAHRFSVANMLRSYIDQIEQNAKAAEKLTDATNEWI